MGLSSRRSAAPRRSVTMPPHAAAMSIAMQAAQEPYWCGMEEAGPHGQTSTGATCKTVCNVTPRETAPQPAAAKALGLRWSCPRTDDRVLQRQARGMPIASQR